MPFRQLVRRLHALMWLLPLALAVAAAPPIRAQAPEAAPKVAVIDVRRILTDSKAGQEVVGQLKQLREEKLEEARVKQQELRDLRARIAEGRLSLSEERLEAMQKEMEEKAIAFQRFQDDADRALQKKQEESFGEIEKRVMPIINDVGIEFGFTLIFNKFQSGLVYAADSVDITDLILERFDASYTPSGN